MVKYLLRRCLDQGSLYISKYITIYPLVMTNIAMEAMAHRNKWFTWVYLLKMVIFHGELLVITLLKMGGFSMANC